MKFFHLGYLGKGLVSLYKTFFFSDVSKILIESRPFMFFSIRGRFQIGGCIPNRSCGVGGNDLCLSPFKQIEEELCMLSLVFGCFQKEGGNLLIALFSGCTGKVSVAVPCLGFASKRS